MALAPEPNNPQQEASQDVSNSLVASASSPMDGNSSNNAGDQTSSTFNARPSPPAGTNAPTIAAPHPKRFNAVNINKKFLQKDFTAPGPAPAVPNSAVTKSTGPASQPQSTSRSRLFTTKVNTTTPSGPHGSGWSRPSSTAPSPASSTPQANEKTQTSATPQNMKGTNSQQRPASATKDRQSSSSPVWGNRKSVPAAPLDVSARSDFPTAAEVAQETSKKSKSSDSHPAPESVASQQARMDEADTFRGVHLDPNTHHWDEMEEDDDNFLGGVVEFDDGRQYKVEPASTPPSEAQDDRPPTPGNDEPVSKEERFGNDIDRHWPRGRPSDSRRNGSTSPASSHKSPRLHYDSRVLFNERSNRLEPYSGSQRAQPFSSKRGPQTEGSGKPRANGPSEGQRPSSYMRSHDTGARSGPHPSKSNEGTWNNRHNDRSVPERGRRLSNMGPPPVPPYARNPSTDPVRQLPPHLSQPPPFYERERRLSRESRYSQNNQVSQLGREDSWLSPKAANIPISPALSISSKLPPESPIELLAGGADLDEIRKDVMHNAAERARKRRQQEEEEREREKERAKKKAAELEAKYGPAKPKDKPSDTEEQVNSVIAEAIASVEVPKVAVTSPSSPKFIRSPSLKGVPRQPSDSNNSRPFPARRTSSAYNDSKGTEAPTPANQAESWRTRKVSGSAPPERAPEPVPPFPPVFPQPVSVLEERPEEELEVVDFSDLGRLVGASEPEASKELEKPKAEKPAAWPHPVASDFFDDDAKPVDEPWRKAGETTGPNRSKTHEYSYHNRSSSGQYNGTGPSHPRSHQRPVNHYKEATMSALDDTISRIKGAIDDMHEPNGSHKPSLLGFKQDRWGPRSRKVPDILDFEQEHREVFDVSGSEPPRSPPPAWHTFVVSLGKFNEPLEPVEERQLVLWEKASFVRWDTMTWDPPVEGMSRRDFSLNDVLFRKSPTPKGKYKYRVLLPKTGSKSFFATGPRVNLPSKPVGAFGRAREANESSNWRKVIVSPTEPPTESKSGFATSQSPPPAVETPSSSQNTATPPLTNSTSTETNSVRGDSSTPRNGTSTSPRVSFTSNVENVPSSGQPTQVGSGVDAKSQPTSPFSAASGKVESSSSDESAERPVTPPQRHPPNATWAKSPLAFTTLESPAKGPDPEHLKAVWSQTPEKSHIPTSNSLEGIGDDLTALAFTIQEVKSEDGETPPPQPPAASSRIAFDVTRAFQQVPSSTTPRVAAPTAPAPPAPVPRHASFGYPATSPSARPAYPAAYPPQIVPSPSPAMYPSPIQPRMSMNGQPPQVYPQPVWMVQAPPMASPGGMMRPLPSPYSMPMMPFSPGTPVYTMPPPPMPMNGAMPPRAMPPPSPIMPPQFPASPVMMPPPVQRQPSQTYMGPPPASIGGRGQRTPSGQGYSNPGFMNQNWRS